MPELKVLLCLFLVFALFTSSETRSPGPLFNKSNRALIEIVKEVLKASIERQGGLSDFEPKRQSPGGPDSRHH